MAATNGAGAHSSRRSRVRPRQTGQNNLYTYPSDPALKPSPSRGGFGWGWVSPTPPQIKSRRGRSPDLRQGFDGFALTQRDGVAVAVAAVDDHAVAADHHFSHQVAVADEDHDAADVFAA